MLRINKRMKAKVFLLGLVLGLWLVSGAAALQIQSSFEEIEISFVSDGIKLAGTLTLPVPRVALVPAVLLIAGSGPVDRDENTPTAPLNIFNTLAHQLARAGIASLRYDKRGVGQSGGEYLKTSFTDLVQDAQAALLFLKSHAEINAEKIFALGHSEGGYIVPLLALADEKLTGILSIAGPARPFEVILLWQNEAILRVIGASDEEIRRQLEFVKAFIAFAKQSRGDWEDYTFEQVRAHIPMLTRRQFEALKQTASLKWWREHFTRDPLEPLRRVKTAVFVLHGNKDLQVPWEEALVWAAELKKAGNEEVEIVILADLNHILRRDIGKPDWPYDLSLPVDERVLRAITDWLTLKAQS